MVRDYFKNGKELPTPDVYLTKNGYEIKSEKDLNIVAAYMICGIPMPGNLKVKK